MQAVMAKAAIVRGRSAGQPYEANELSMRTAAIIDASVTSFAARSIKSPRRAEPPRPGYQPEDQPQLICSMRASVLKVPPQQANTLGIDAQILEIGAAAVIVHAIAQRPSQPSAERHAESHFGTVDQGARNALVKELTQDPLRRSMTALEAHRQAQRQLDDAMVEQRRANFEADRHGRPIDFGQNVFRQVRDEIEKPRATIERHPGRSRQRVRVQR